MRLPCKQKHKFPLTFWDPSPARCESWEAKTNRQLALAHHKFRGNPCLTEPPISLLHVRPQKFRATFERVISLLLDCALHQSPCVCPSIENVPAIRLE